VGRRQEGSQCPLEARWCVLLRLPAGRTDEDSSLADCWSGSISPGKQRVFDHSSELGRPWEDTAAWGVMSTIGAVGVA
jgi:hypothetical protein